MVNATGIIHGGIFVATTIVQHGISDGCADYTSFSSVPLSFCMRLEGFFRDFPAHSSLFFLGVEVVFLSRVAEALVVS